MKLRKESGVIYKFLSKRYADMRNNLHNVHLHLNSTDSTEILQKNVDLLSTAQSFDVFVSQRRFLILIFKLLLEKVRKRDSYPA
jgi:hypothetical protein